MGEQRWLRTPVSTWGVAGRRDTGGAAVLDSLGGRRRASHAGGAGCPADLQGAGNLRGQRPILSNAGANSFGNLSLLVLFLKKKMQSIWGRRPEVMKLE